MNQLLGHLLLLAQTPPVPAHREELTQSALKLWIILAVGGLVLIAVIGTIIASNRRRREARARENKRPGKRIPDAWEESARRLEVQPLENPEDDDLRVDR